MMAGLYLVYIPVRTRRSCYAAVVGLGLFVQLSTARARISAIRALGFI